MWMWLKEWFMDIFFTGVGLTASWKLLKQGGKVCIGITITTIGLILGQDILGVILSMAFGMHPLQGTWPWFPVPNGRCGHLWGHCAHL